jgi:CheY-like chemotaxis protein
MELRTETELTQEIERLRTELARRERDRIEAAAEQAGADLFLTKPFSPLELLRLVDRLSAE